MSIIRDDACFEAVARRENAVAVALCTRDIDSGQLDNDLLARAYILRGVAHSNGGRQGPGIEDLDRGIALKPDLASGYNSRGVAYARLGQYDRALQDFDEALRLNPESASARANREQALRDKQLSERSGQR